MKTRAGIQHYLTLAGLAATLAMSPSNAFADDKRVSDAKAQAGIKDAMHGYDLVISNGVLFEHGPRQSIANIAAVVDALRRQYPSVNIVVAPELSEVMLADLKLHAHELPEMLEALRVASGGKFDWSGPGLPNTSPGSVGPKPVDPTTGLPVEAPPPDPNTGLYVLRAPAATQAKERVVEAFNISSYMASRLFEAQAATGAIPMGEHEKRKIEDMTVVQLEDLIVQTVASYKQTDENEARRNLKFQFHPGANLLIVIGPRYDVEAVRKLMGALVTEPDGMRVRSGFTADFAPQQRPALPAPPEPVLVEAFPIKSAKMETAYTTATSLLSGKNSKVVVSDDRSKTLIVAGTKAELSTIKKALDELEAASKPYVGDKPVVEH